MSELYLIAHKVRGASAFDIAHQMGCPECISMGCPECDDLGYWWIVPTSGHRAYPYWNMPMPVVEHNGRYVLAMGQTLYDQIPFMPESALDHYPHREAPTISLTQALGLGKPTTPQPPLVRRM